ncbi:MAG TPA: hypothetical protein VIU42_14040 [Xanthobacteraceae bacterium]
MADTFERPAPLFTVPYVQWGPVFAGAVSAAALATVLHAFAGAVGLAVSSTAPTWRDASTGLWILSGVYLILVALASYGLGGYIAGLLRERFATTARADEIELRDNIHGLLVWAVATLITAFLLLAAASASTRLAAPSGGGAGPATSVAGENIIAYDVDRLLRGDRRAADAGDVTATRAEVARILLTSSGHSGVAAEDRGYLVRLVGLRTGLTAPEAERRVDTAIANAKNNIAKARRSTTILAFMAGAAALLGAVAAWFAAAIGGQHRDDTTGSGRWNVLGRRSITQIPAE